MRKRLRSDWRNPQAGFLALIEILVVVLIIAMLAAYFLTGGSPVMGGGGHGRGGGSGATSTPGRAAERAESTVCRNNLSQIRAAIATYNATSGGYPPDLDSLGESSLAKTCPVSGEAYQYDATTGQVTCPYPEHQGY